MPRVNLNRSRYERLIQTIYGAKKASGKTNVQISTACGWKSETTFGNRINHPENFTIGELLKLSRQLNIPVDELRQAIF